MFSEELFAFRLKNLKICMICLPVRGFQFRRSLLKKKYFRCFRIDLKLSSIRKSFKVTQSLCFSYLITGINVHELLGFGMVSLKLVD